MGDWPLLLLPVHIAFLELIIDPACTLIFEAEAAEADVMQRPPRTPGERLFHFAPVHANDLALSAAAAPVCLLWFEALKLVRRVVRERATARWAEV